LLVLQVNKLPIMPPNVFLNLANLRMLSVGFNFIPINAAGFVERYRLNIGEGLSFVPQGLMGS
jgi:hypothetical protein